MKCPVCKNELSNDAKICPVCKFSKLHVEFFSVYAATNWVETVVLPYRKQWLQSEETKSSNSQNPMPKHTDNSNEQAFKSDPTDFEFTIDDKGVTLTKYRNYGFKSYVKIPESICGKNVYYLAPSLFKDCREITSVFIPNTVQVIGENAFENTGVTEVQLPPYLKAIGAYAFKNTPLKAIALPYGLSYIGIETFCNTNITSIVFPEYIKNIPAGVCCSCSNLNSVIIKGAIDLSTFAFSNCINLESVQLPETLINISGDNKVKNYVCLSLAKTSVLVLPKSLQSISIGYNLPAKTIVVQNDKMKWLQKNNDTFVDMLNESSLPFGFDMDFSDVFSAFGGSFYGNSTNKSNEYTLYCNAGSTAHELARKKGYSVKPLSSY